MSLHVSVSLLSGRSAEMEVANEWLVDEVTYLLERCFEAVIFSSLYTRQVLSHGLP